MEIENQKQKGSRFFKNGKKKRSVFGIDADEEATPQNNRNHIKLFMQQQDPNSATLITPIVLDFPISTIIKQRPKNIEDKLSTTYSKFVKNEIYYGQFSYKEKDDYQTKGYEPQNLQEKLEEMVEQKQVEEVKVKKERKLKRKNRTSINKFQQIILDQQTEAVIEYQGSSDKDKRLRNSSNGSSNCQLQDTIPQNKRYQNMPTSSQNQTTSESAQKGSNYSPNNIPSQNLSTPKKQEQEEKQHLSQQQNNQIGISSFEALLGINNQTVNLKPMMYNPLPPNSLMKCYIKRTSSFNLTLLIYLDDHKFLMKSESQNASIGCNHYISLSNQVNKNSQAYLGKLRSDFVGSVYTLYDSGVSQKERKQVKSNNSQMRGVMANVEYQNNILGIKGPRRIKVRIPNPKIKDKSIFKLKDKQTLASLKDSEDIINTPVIVLQNKKPVWNQKIKTYALNFGGRVKMPSIKNFILEDNQGETIMTFGKVDSNTFTLEFRYPLSPFQAFGVAMSSFDFKLSCE